jgi:antimicrobial peptide system SdpA family protein
LYFTSIYFGNNPLNRRSKSKAKLVSIFPEGWAFFTKNSTDPRVYVFRVESTGITEVNVRNFSAEFFYGLSRDNRLLSMQFGNILKTAFTDSLCSIEFRLSDPQKICDLRPDALTYSDVLIEKKTATYIRGKYLLAIQKMLPWPLIHKEPAYESNYTIYPVNVLCHE